MTTQALARRPQDVRAEIAADPERRELLRQATAELATAVEGFIAQYLAITTEQAQVLTLWTMHTWVADIADCTPYLLVTSAEPGAGKSRVLEVLAYVVHKPWLTSDTTATALFRRMDQESLTLLLDEIDVKFKGGSSYEALRGVLNSGNRPAGTTTRCDGKWGTRDYRTYGPKALAGIDNGFLPDTIIDRSIRIEMHKTSGQVKRLRLRQAAAEAAPLAYTLQQWSAVVVDELAREEPALPCELSDRAADAWEPILAISQFAGPEWQDRAQDAALALSGASTGLSEGAEGMLLPAMVGVMA
jgi:hypothetical protein